MRAFALKTAVAAFNKAENSAEKDIAAQIKKEFDKEYTVFGSHFTVSSLSFIQECCSTCF